MSLFPDNPSLVLAPYTWRPRFRTFIAGPFNNENVVTRAGVQFPLHSGTVTFWTQGWTTLAETIYEFFVARKGRYESFAFYDPQGWDASPVGILWKGCYVGVGTGAQTVFDLPLRNTNNDSNRKIYCNGVDKTSNGTWSQGTGADGRDKFTFSTYTPANGEVITCSGIARRVWKTKFANDEFELTAREVNIYELSVDLVEVP